MISCGYISCKFPHFNRIFKKKILRENHVGIHSKSRGKEKCSALIKATYQIVNAQPIF